ncbi:MAG: YchJ family metal-binding protein [Simkaniaceae bacterium]
MKRCPCQSNKYYKDCCQPYHNGQKNPRHAQDLMRSRYCAYALNLSKYIIDTTHEENPYYHKNLNKWIEEIADFSQNSQFLDLKILEINEGDTEAFVTFKAIIHQNNRDVSFTEKSRFLKCKGRWLYRSGEILV